MGAKALIPRFTGITPLAVLAVLLLVALYMMSAATQNSAMFGHMYSVLVVINVVGVLLLLVLIVLNVLHLVEQYRAQVLGTRLTLRLVTIFVALAVLPVAVVFVFSVQTVNRGIDYWFDVKIERALDDALLLGRTALEAIRSDLVKSAEDMAQELEAIPDPSVLPSLNFLREQGSVTELTVFSQDGKIIAASTQEGPIGTSILPALLSDTILAQVRQGQNFASLDAVSRQGFRVRVVVPILSRDVAAPMRLLQLIQVLPTRYSKLAESVQNAYAEYEKLVYLRGPLKFSFLLTLSLVALLTVLLAVWAGIFFARRLVAPIRDLAEGTRAVAAGDYRTRIPVMSRDEIGLLVESFNDMTARVHGAQTQIRQSQQEAEVQRAYLETVLAHLSSGVISVDADGQLRTFNAAAEQILGAELKNHTGAALGSIGAAQPRLLPLIETLERELGRGDPEWQTDVVLFGTDAQRTLLVRGTRLAGRRRAAGYVIVFDDVTALMQAQRAAAWGEVARRMAHEIKNPLTPIQLSAERIRHKYLRLLGQDERDTLDRATRTIVEQVESLKGMVNAFSEYARPSSLAPSELNLNDLVRDVIELHRAEPALPSPRQHNTAESVRIHATTAGGEPIAVELRLAPDLPLLRADAGRLRQILHNLLLNARDALADLPAPRLLVSTQHLEQGGRAVVELKVWDNGPGFPPKLLAQLFEPYVTTKEKGTGLGLAIVKRIVEEHGGTVRAENPAGGGAQVIVELPSLETIRSVATAPAAKRPRKRVRRPFAANGAERRGKR